MLNLDTHILLKSLTGELTSRESDVLDADEWAISCIVLWEIAMLAERSRINMDLDDPALGAILREIRVLPIDTELCLLRRSLDFKSDPADEIIAATSIRYGAPLVTRDRRLAASKRVPLAL